MIVRYAARSLAVCVFGAGGWGTVTARSQAKHYEALQAARKRMRTEEFKRTYAKRAGIEGTFSQGVRTCEGRCSRYIGLAKTRLMQLLVAAALNFLRVAAWLAEQGRAKTRRCAFAALAPGLR